MVDARRQRPYDDEALERLARPGSRFATCPPRHGRPEAGPQRDRSRSPTRGRRRRRPRAGKGLTTAPPSGVKPTARRYASRRPDAPATRFAAPTAASRRTARGGLDTGQQGPDRVPAGSGARTPETRTGIDTQRIWGQFWSPATARRCGPVKSRRPAAARMSRHHSDEPGPAERGPGQSRWSGRWFALLDLVRNGVDVLGHDVTDGVLDDAVGLGEGVADLDRTGVGHEGDDAEWPGATASERSFSSPILSCSWWALPKAAARAQRRGAADDRRREDQTEGSTTDEAPLQPLSGGAVGGLLDLELAVGVAVDDDDAVDGEVTAVLERLRAS